MPATAKLLMMAAPAGGDARSEYWINASGGTGLDRANAVAIDGFDNVVVAGITQITGNSDAVVMKINSFGGLEWERILGGTDVDQWNTAMAKDFGWQRH